MQKNRTGWAQRPIQSWPLKKLLNLCCGRRLVSGFAYELKEFAALIGRRKSVSDLLARLSFPGHFHFFNVGIRNFNVRPGFQIIKLHVPSISRLAQRASRTVRARSYHKVRFEGTWFFLK
jgi:hypothetical protein